MHAFRSHLAAFLLLCFARVLVPDAWILALHAHQHTLVESAHATLAGSNTKALLTAQHQHCQSDHFYNVQFQPALPPELPVCPLAHTTACVLPIVVGWRTTQFSYGYLRGPPAC